MILIPLNCLLRTNSNCIWSCKCDKAFKKIKDFQSKNFLAHYDPELLFVLIVNASPYKVDVVLLHVYLDGSEQAIQYISQSLIETQKKYSQIDKETYAIIF